MFAGSHFLTASMIGLNTIKRFILLFLILELSIFSSATAQITVSGTVSNVNGPLPRANIHVKNSTMGTQTNFEGKYRLNDLGVNETLIFSYIGYKSVEIPVNNQSTINVILQEAVEVLDEIFIIGYGQTMKKDVTGAVDMVHSEEFNSGVIFSPEQLVQGKAAGVQITQASGEPGTNVIIRIRGTSSVRSNNNPLFVIDGLPIPDETLPAIRGRSGIWEVSPRNPLNFINPSDVESISILKDASASAIYGSRAANGVVIITTKGGTSRKGLFEFSSGINYSFAAKKFRLLNRWEFLEALPRYGGDAAALDYGFDTNWQNVLLREVISQKQALSYSRKYGSGDIRASFGYEKQLGIVKNYAFERISGKIHATQLFFNKKLKLTTNITQSRINDDGGAIANNAGGGDLLGTAYLANPTWPARLSFTTGGNELNPLQLLYYHANRTNTNRLLANLDLQFRFLRMLDAKISLGYDDSESKNKQVQSGLTDSFFPASGNGLGFLSDSHTTSRLLEFTLGYERQFHQSRLDFFLGYSYQGYRRSGATNQGLGFTTTDLNKMIADLEKSKWIIENSLSGSYQQFGFSPNGSFVNRLFPMISQNESVPPPNGVAVRSVSGDYYDFTNELQSFFGRINYAIKDRYLFTGNLRVDGSSRFGPNHQYGFFPSAAIAWKLHEEDFIPDPVSTLKLRLSYGITGNQEGLGYGNFTVAQRFAPITIMANGNIIPPGLEIVSFTNDDLKWEETAQANFGIDFGLNRDRLSGSIDLYHKTTRDLLLQQEAAQPSPQPFVFSNLNARIINKGIEFALAYDLIDLDRVQWNMGFNISYNKNQVQDFGGLIPTGLISGPGLSGAFVQLLAEGRPLFSYYLREFGGFDENGISIYPNGDKQVFVGKSALPKFNMGISTNARYKRWDANASLNGQFGFYIYNNTENAFSTAGILGVGRNVQLAVLTNGEAVENSPDVSTRFLEKGDFLRLQNATIGYNVPLKDGLFKSMRFSLTGQNLFVITAYGGLDPEVNIPAGLNNITSLGIDQTVYPRAVTCSLGLSATF